MDRSNARPVAELIAIMEKSEFGKQSLICNEYARFYAETCNTMDLIEFGDAASKKFQDRVLKVTKVIRDYPTVILLFKDYSVFQIEFGKDGEEIVSVGMYVPDLENRTLN